MRRSSKPAPPERRSCRTSRGFHRRQAILPAGSVAVVTGGASGIGLAAASRFAALDMKVCIADLGERRLEAAAQFLADQAPAGKAAILAVEADVSRAPDMARLEDAVRARFGGTDLLMNNAGVQPGSAMFGPAEAWQRVLGVNLWGAIHGTQIFAPRMIARGRPGFIINTGSKQGITTPPGDPAYNVSKAGLKAFTEALQHELRNTEACRISAHLLIPGFVFTPLAAKDRTEKPDAAWTAEQTVDFMMDSLAKGEFYILCPDNDVTRALDERRILWAAGDIVENRPPLSRWHPDFTGAFKAFVDNKA
jgi:NAD(P)-dependent dehydrogenase (short-subunit alcohol dehydrogenase family)